MSSNPKLLPFSGKRTERISIPGQVHVDPEMKRKIIELAEAGDRPLGNEIVRLIKLGIEAEERRSA